ncbi:SOS response-associated peptidase [Quadrisphaera sp. KR29]|uniref:SOS response-associated peptidase n=1 Tax=Quadrisphaera sp. KR29 TaxID=3461391 RepID=UPI004043E868
MCGRYASSRSDAQLVEDYAVDAVVGSEVAPSWNVAPTQQVRAVVEREPRDDEGAAAPAGGGPPGGGGAQRQLRTVRWGLVPSWAKDPGVGSRMINARVETVTEKPAYRRAAARRRCLLPADGYFEWERRPAPDGSGKEVKVPHFLHAADGGPLAFAGLYELWKDPGAPEGEDAWLWTATVITTQAQDEAGRIHDRSPVVLPADFQGDWLDPHLTDLDLVRQVLDAVPPPQLATHEVGRAVGSPRVNGPQLVLPLGELGGLGG